MSDQLAIVGIALLTSDESVRLSLRNSLARELLSHAVVLTRAIGSWADHELGGVVDISVDCSDRFAAVLVQASWVGCADCNATILGAVLIVAKLSIGSADGSLLEGGVGQTAALQVALGLVVEVLESFSGGKSALAAWAIGVLLASLRLEAEALSCWDGHAAASTNDAEYASPADTSSTSPHSRARGFTRAVGTWRGNHVDDLGTRGHTVAVEFDSLAAVFIETAWVCKGDRGATVVAVIGVTELSPCASVNGASNNG